MSPQTVLTVFMTLEEITSRALEGIPASVDDALALEASCQTDRLCDAADQVRRRWCGDEIDTCSIVNARSGRCGEDCKWCAQSRHYDTGISEYESLPRDQVIEAARANARQKVRRFSLVTSGRRLPGGLIKEFCEIYRELSAGTGIGLCASMGLIDPDGLRALRDAGVTRYHCNLETAASYFPRLCTTHTHREKLQTIAWARQAGLEICSGGIIGMGETMRQRLELVQEARMAHAVSVPINILQPIKGTPLEAVPLIGEEEIARSVALMRMVHPKATLRFAGGRARLSRPATLRILRGGMNGALVGDMLTTVGNNVREDRLLFAQAGYREQDPG